MEIVAFVVIAGLVGWWFYRQYDQKKSQPDSNTVQPQTVHTAEPEVKPAAEPEVKPAAEPAVVGDKPIKVRPAKSPATRTKKTAEVKKPETSKVVANPRAKKTKK